MWKINQVYLDVINSIMQIQVLISGTPVIVCPILSHIDLTLSKAFSLSIDIKNLVYKVMREVGNVCTDIIMIM